MSEFGLSYGKKQTYTQDESSQDRTSIKNRNQGIKIKVWTTSWRMKLYLQVLEAAEFVKLFHWSCNLKEQQRCSTISIWLLYEYAQVHIVKL